MTDDYDVKILDVFRGRPDHRVPLSVPINRIDLSRNPNILYELETAMNRNSTVLIGVFFDGIEYKYITNDPGKNPNGGFNWLYFTEVPPYNKYRTAGKHTIEIKTGTWSMIGYCGSWVRKRLYTKSTGSITFTIEGQLEARKKKTFFERIADALGW